MDKEKVTQVRGASPELHQLAWELRNNPTPAEAVLWAALSGKKLSQLRFQHPVGHFILDFYCASCKMVVELDGSIHDTWAEEDAARTEYLTAFGCRVIRFRNEEVLNNLGAVLAKLQKPLRGCLRLPPVPPELGARGSIINSVCVYCGSSAGTKPVYADAAREVGGCWPKTISGWSTAAGGSG